MFIILNYIRIYFYIINFIFLYKKKEDILFKNNINSCFNLKIIYKNK